MIGLVSSSFASIFPPSTFAVVGVGVVVVGVPVAAEVEQPGRLPFLCLMMACCFCFTENIFLTWSMLSLWTVKPTTTGDMGVEQEPLAFGLSGLLALDERVRRRFFVVERSSGSLVMWLLWPLRGGTDLFRIGGRVGEMLTSAMLENVCAKEGSDIIVDQCKSM